MGYLDWLPKMELMLQEDSKFNLLGGMCIKKNCKCIYSMGWTDNTKGERLIIYTAQKIEEIFNGRLQFLCSDIWGVNKSTLSWQRPLSCRKQSADLRSKSMDWFLYDNGLRHERVNDFWTEFRSKTNQYLFGRDTKRWEIDHVRKVRDRSNMLLELY